MKDFKKNRATGLENESQLQSASEQKEESRDFTAQDQSAQSATNNTQNYNYDEYDAYSPWG